MLPRTFWQKSGLHGFNFQGSMQRKYIPFDIFLTRCSFTQFIYFWKTALHVWGGIFTHHQEHIQLYLQYLVLVNRYCYLPLLWESWSWSECGVGIVPIIRSTYNFIYSIWYLLIVTATCLCCGRVGAALSVVWELYPSSGAHTTVFTVSGTC